MLVVAKARNVQRFPAVLNADRVGTVGHKNQICRLRIKKRNRAVVVLVGIFHDDLVELDVGSEERFWVARTSFQLRENRNVSSLFGREKEKKMKNCSFKKKEKKEREKERKRETNFTSEPDQ